MDLWYRAGYLFDRLGLLVEVVADVAFRVTEYCYEKSAGLA